MATITLLSSVALATVFVVSGIAKLVDRDGTRQAVTGFGVPARLVPAVSVALAPAELVVAAALLVPGVAVAGLVLALMVLAAMSTAVVLALRTGRRPDCRCFGRIGGADVSARTVLRNGVLAMLAVVGLVAAAAGESLSAAAATGAASGGVLVAGLVILAEWAAGRRSRRARDLADESAYERSVDARVPARAPGFRVPTLAGPEVTLVDLLSRGHPLLLVFLSPGCGPCSAMREAVARWSEAYRDRLTVAVVAGGSPAANAGLYQQMPELLVLLPGDRELDGAFGVTGPPAAVLVEPDGHIRGSAAGERLIRRLLVAGLAGADHDLGQQRLVGAVSPGSLTLKSVPRPRALVTVHAVGDGTVLVDEAEGSSLALDRIGTLVWSVLDGSSPLEEIVADLSAVFGAPPETVGPDVLELVRCLGRAGMLEGVRPGLAPERADTPGNGARARSVAPR